MNTLQTILENYAQLFGYENIDVPIFEPVDTFLTKAGNHVFNRLITFNVDGVTMALRPEFTAVIAKNVSQSTLPKRLQCSGPIFHHHTSSLDWSQESFGIELLGVDGSFADAEIIAFAALSMETLGIDNYQIVVGHVGLTRALLENFGLPKRLFRYLLNHRQQIATDSDSFLKDASNDFQFTPQHHENDWQSNDIAAQEMLQSMFKRTNMPLGSRTTEDIIQRLNEQQQTAVMYEQMVAAAKFLQDWSNITCSISDAKDVLYKHITDKYTNTLVADWLHGLHLVQSYGIRPEKLVIKPDLVRTWDYYTGVVFELRTDDKTYIGGGGRYNDLIKLLNGTDESAPAIGFALNLDMITTLLNHSVNEQAIFNIVGENEVGDEQLIEWSQQLRKYDIPVYIGSNQTAITNEILIGDEYASYQNQRFSIDNIEALVFMIKG